jgi:hypothetical protein
MNVGGLPSSGIFVNFFLQGFIVEVFKWRSFVSLVYSLSIFFEATRNGIVFLIFSQPVHCYCIENYWFFYFNFMCFYIAKTVYQIKIFGRIFEDFKYIIISSANIICKIWILYISFSCIIALARNSSMYWISVRRVDTLIFFLTLEKMVSVVPNLVWCWL